MKLGMPALIEFDSIEDNVRLCKKLGLSFVELNMNFPYCMIDRLDPLYLKSIGEANNIFFTMHMPDETDIGSFYDSVRDGYLKLFEEAIPWAAKANIRLLNMHISKGAYMTLPDKKVYIYDKYSDIFEEKFISGLKIISDLAENYGVTVCIENSNNFYLPYIQSTIDKAVKLNNIKLTWDTGHDFISGYKDRKVLLSHEDKITHMHLHDAKEKKDHQIIYDGILKIDELITFGIGNGLSVLIEVKDVKSLEESIRRLKSKKSEQLNLL